MASLSDEKLWLMIRKLNVSQLKDILGKGGISQSGIKAVLQQRVFYAVRLGLEVIPTQEQEDKQVAATHKAKLNLGNGFILPHPLTIENWENHFPDTTEKDVTQYFDKCNQDVGITTEGKKALAEGFSLFTSNHVQSVGCNKIIDLLGVCYVRGYVIPTMRLSSDKYYVWVQLYKESGAIRTADCHCIAGVSGMCKHIAALLYYVANEVSKGKNLPCTSVKQVWHQPAQKKLKTAAMISDIKTPKSASRVCPEERPHRNDFDPRPILFRRKKTLSDFKLDELSELSNGKAAVLLYSSRFRQGASHDMEVLPDISFIENEVELQTTVHVPSVMSSFAKHIASSSECFIESLKFNDLGRLELEQSTRAQTQSELWVEQRKGRFTASVMHRVLDHVSHENNVCGEVASIVDSVMGYNHTFSSTPTSHGIKGEPIVKRRYTTQQRKLHKGLTVTSSGLWVLNEFPLIAATPDGIVKCECCPTRVLEIKCPYKDRKLTISEYAEQGTSKSKAKHSTVIIMKDNKIVINTEHQYYVQVQTQILCTGLSSCDLVIGTEALRDNFSVFTIHKDPDFCAMLQSKAKIFFHHVIFPELQNKMYLKKKQAKKEEKAAVSKVINT